MRRRAWTGLVVGAMALAACGVQNDATPRNIIDDSGVASGDTATDAGDTSEAPYRIFLLSPQSPSQLRGVRRNVSTTLRGLFEALLQGPTESDRDARLRTAIPSDLRRSSNLGPLSVESISVTDKGAFRAGRHCAATCVEKSRGTGEECVDNDAERTRATRLGGQSAAYKS